MKKKAFTQLNLIQRTQLQTLLKEKKSLNDIALEIGVSRQTLYREIIRNSYTTIHDSYDQKTSCMHFKECARGNKSKHLCPSQCIKYSPGRQDCLKKYPFVCN